MKNSLYNNDILKSSEFQIPLIVVGNLSTGGTGKTPHTEYISEWISNLKKTAVLSRGYGRQTKGYLLATPASTAQEIGDEPLQVAQTLPQVTVAVCEDRTMGVSRLIHEQGAEAIVLDDAFQHRKIKGSLNILITTYDQPYYEDLLLPAGNLRETHQNSSRADLIIVSKCPVNMAASKRDEIIEKLKLASHQTCFFTTIKYGSPKRFNGDQNWEQAEHITLVTGIVNPTPLKNHLKLAHKTVTPIAFKDHHNYTYQEVTDIINTITSVENNFVVATTSKDKVKLSPIVHAHKTEVTFFEIPIQISFLFNQTEEFNQIILDHVSTF